MSWKTNPLMEWSTNGGATWTKVTDHGRSPVGISVERIETKKRMADGTLRRYVVAKKYNFSWSWEHLPNKETPFLANGTTTGQWLEDFHNNVDGSFLMRLRSGSDATLNMIGLDGVIVEVMISDFSKEIVKRGPAFDLWAIDMSLEEV